MADDRVKQGHEYWPWPDFHTPSGHQDVHNSMFGTAHVRDANGALKLSCRTIAPCGCNAETTWQAGSYRGRIILPERSEFICVWPGEQ